MPASRAKAGLLSAKSRAARVRVWGLPGVWLARAIAASKSFAAEAAANQLPSSPGVWATRSVRISVPSLSGYLRATARNQAR